MKILLNRSEHNLCGSSCYHESSLILGLMLRGKAWQHRLQDSRSPKTRAVEASVAFRSNLCALDGNDLLAISWYFEKSW